MAKLSGTVRAELLLRNPEGPLLREGVLPGEKFSHARTPAGPVAGRAFGCADNGAGLALEPVRFAPRSAGRPVRIP